MNEYMLHNYLGYGIFAIRVLIIFLVAIFCYVISKRKSTYTKITFDFVESRLKYIKSGYFNYERIESFLMQYGIKFSSPNVNPVIFTLLKVMFFGISVFMSMKFLHLNIGIGIAIGVFGFFLPDLLCIYNNKKDNDAMLEDIQKVFYTLKIQAKAGVFILNSLSECYLVCRNRRLKNNLLVLTNKIFAKGDMEEAIDEFNFSFKNDFIDTLCTVLKQALKSGQMVEMLEDISEQLDDIQEVIDLKDAERRNMKSFILLYIITLGAMAAMLFVLTDFMFGNLKF